MKTKYQLYHQVKYECLTGEEISPSNQQEIIEQAKFTYSPLGKAFEKQTKTIEDQGKKDSALALLQGREMVFTAFKSGIFPRSEESQEGEGLKILTTNQMLKRLPIALAQIKAGNNSKSLLNEIRQIAYSLYRSKEITKKVYNNIIKSIKV